MNSFPHAIPVVRLCIILHVWISHVAGARDALTPQTVEGVPPPVLSPSREVTPPSVTHSPPSAAPMETTSDTAPPPTTEASTILPRYDASGMLIPQLSDVVLMDTHPPVIQSLPEVTLMDVRSGETVPASRSKLTTPMPTLASKIEELLAQNDDELAKVSRGTIMSLLQSHLMIAEAKDRATSLPINQVRSVRHILEMLQREHNVLLDQAWSTEENSERVQLESAWSAESNAEEGIMDEIHEDNNGTDDANPISHSIGYLAVIIAGSIAATFLVFALFMFIRTLRRPSSSDQNSYELHQSLNGNI